MSNNRQIEKCYAYQNSRYLTEVRIFFYWWQGRKTRLKILKEEQDKLIHIACWKTYKITAIMAWSHNMTQVYSWNDEGISKWVEKSIREVKVITLKKLLSA